MLLLFTVPVTNDRGARYMERALAAIHQSSDGGDVLKLGFAPVDGRVGLTLEFDARRRDHIAGPVVASFPNASLTTIENVDGAQSGWESWSVPLTLAPDIFPLLRYAQFDDPFRRSAADPIATVLQAVQPGEGSRCRVEIAVAPASATRRRRAVNAIRLLDREFFRKRHHLAHYFAERAPSHPWHPTILLLTALAKCSPHVVRSAIETSASRQHDREEHPQAAADKLGGHLFEASIRLTAQVPPGCRTVAEERLRQLAGAFGGFTKSNLAMFRTTRTRRGTAPEACRFLLSHEELATIFCPPTFGTFVERMQSSSFVEMEPPPHFSSGTEADAVTLGRVRFRNDERLIGLTEADRMRHLYVVGATGAGKSTLLLNLMRQDMQAGNGLTLVDVHGELADAAISLVPKFRTHDAIVFDPASDNPVPFNPLACTDRERVGLTTSGVVSAFRKLFDSWGPRLENLLRYTAYTTIEQGGGLREMLRLLTDRSFRECVVPGIADEVVRSFWTNEFAAWPPQYRTEAVSSVTNKIMPFITDRRLRAMAEGGGGKSLDLRKVLDERRILIVNVSRGRLGHDNATLLGSLLLTSIEQAALSRADTPEGERTPHFLYLDEFQSLVTPSTAIMLSEARKYRLGLTLSHQMTRQLDPATYHAVIGNCGTMLSFRVGMEDADLLAPALSRHRGDLVAEQLTGLPNYTAYARPLIDGTPTAACSIETLPPPSAEDRSEIVRRVSARTWSRSALSSSVVTQPKRAYAAAHGTL